MSDQSSLEKNIELMSRLQIAMDEGRIHPKHLQAFIADPNRVLDKPFVESEMIMMLPPAKDKVDGRKFDASKLIISDGQVLIVRTKDNMSFVEFGGQQYDFMGDINFITTLRRLGRQGRDGLVLVGSGHGLLIGKKFHYHALMPEKICSLNGDLIFATAHQGGWCIQSTSDIKSAFHCDRTKLVDYWVEDGEVFYIDSIDDESRKLFQVHKASKVIELAVAHEVHRPVNGISPIQCHVDEGWTLNKDGRLAWSGRAVSNLLGCRINHKKDILCLVSYELGQWHVMKGIGNHGKKHAGELKGQVSMWNDRSLAVFAGPEGDYVLFGDDEYPRFKQIDEKLACFGKGMPVYPAQNENGKWNVVFGHTPISNSCDRVVQIDVTDKIVAYVIRDRRLYRETYNI